MESRSIRGVADFLVGVPVDNKFGLINGQFDLFAKVNNFGLGFVMDKYPDNIDSIKAYKSLFAGIGFNIVPNKLWWGASAMYRGKFDDKYNLKTFRFNSSLVYTPISSLITSFGVSNMYKDFDYFNWTLGLIYSPFEWMTLHTNIGYSPQAHFRGNSKFSPDVYISLGGLSDYAIFSLGYKYEDNTFRLGVELSIDKFSVGIIPKFSTNKYTGSNLFLRLKTERFLNTADLRNRSTISVKSSDAGISDNGYLWSPADNTATPKEIIQIINNAGSNYKTIYNELNTASQKNNAMKYIANRYYQTPNLLLDDLNKSIIRTPWNYNIISQKEAIINTNQKIIRFKVKDQYGRDVPKLSRKDFILADTSYKFVTIDEVNAMPKEKIDIVFLQDCSPTLINIIDEIKLKLNNFFRALEIKGIDFNIGGILYGEQIYEVLQPTDEINKFVKFYSGIRANAIDEVSSIALDEALDLKFRPDSKKIIILITDEPTFQTNSQITEPELIKKYWKAGASVYSILDFSKYNSGLLTKLTLGKEYEIYDDIDKNLNNISSDIISTYSAIIKPKGQEATNSAFLRGICRDEDNWKVQSQLTFTDKTGKLYKNISNAITGYYEIDLPENQIYKVIASTPNYDTIQTIIDMSQIQKGDTLEYNFVFKNPKSTISGSVSNENGTPINATIYINEMLSDETLLSMDTDTNGKYFTNLQEGKIYFMTASANGYIPFTKEIDAIHILKGTPLIENFKLLSIDDVVSKQKSIILEEIVFESRQFVINEAAYSYLNRLADFLKSNPNLIIEISAHTDAIGTEESNNNLSKQRADAVAKYLINHGVDNNSIISIGMGSIKPIATNESEEGRAKNRRIEIKLSRK